MAAVRIDFVQPSDPGLAALRIWEAPAKDDTYVQIERTTAIGTYPNYISTYTTQNASSATGWFRIQWEDTGGALSELSEPRQGGADNLVSEIVSRMLLRDPNIEEAIAVQEAEAVIQWYYGGQDPYSIDPDTVSYNTMSGLTLMAMARCYMFTFASTTSTSMTDVSDYTAGLVSQRSGSTSGSATSTSPLGAIDALLEQANVWLGTGVSLVMLMEEVAVAGGLAREVAEIDQSRLMVEFE